MVFLAQYIMRGRMQAMLVAAALALLSLKIPPVSIVSSASIALVTLRKGSNEGLLILLCAAVVAAIMGGFLLGNYMVAFGFSMMLWFPVWAISIVLREGRNLNLALDVAVLLGTLVILGFYIYFDDPAALWNGIITAMLEPVLKLPDIPVEELKQTVLIMSRLMSGIIAAGLVSSLLLGLMLGRWWQAALYNPGGFREEFVNLNTHPVIAGGSLLIMAAAYLGSGVLSQIAANITILLFVLYSFIGTAVAHVLIANSKAKKVLLPLFYVLVFAIPHILLPVAVLGLFDAWLKLRSRLTKQTDINNL